MVDAHEYRFFGQNTLMIFQSASSGDPFMFLKFIKKNSDGTWEKLSSKEGTTIKCSLEEMVMILSVLKGKMRVWETIHRFQGSSTQIRIERTEADQICWLQVGAYSKKLSSGQGEIFKSLLHHVLKEKIEHATVPRTVKEDAPPEEENEDRNKEQKSQIPVIEKIEKVEIDVAHATKNEKANKVMDVKGQIMRETEKAYLIQFESGKEAWVPKSTIQAKNGTTFHIQEWLLKNLKIIP